MKSPWPNGYRSGHCAANHHGKCHSDACRCRCHQVLDGKTAPSWRRAKKALGDTPRVLP